VPSTYRLTLSTLGAAKRALLQLTVFTVRKTVNTLALIASDVTACTRACS